MWARVIEILLAGWLAMSPFVFKYSSKEHFFWVNDYVCAFFIALFALLSFLRPLRKMHILSLGIAAWLMLAAYRSFPELASPAEENSLAIGFLLLMFAIVPTQSHQPPVPWQEFENNKEGS